MIQPIATWLYTIFGMLEKWYQSCRKKPSEICLTEITHGSWPISGSRGVSHNLPLINLKPSSSFEILLLLFSIYVRFDAVTFSVCDDLGLDTTEPLSISFLSDSA